jgi:hypothetical protein
VRIRLSRLAPLALGLVLAGCGSVGYAAKVGTTTITTTALRRELAQVAANRSFDQLLARDRLPVYGPGHQSYTTLFVDNILNRRITIDRVEALDRKLGLVPTPLEARLARALAASSVGSPAVFDGFSPSYRAQLVADTEAIVTLEAHLAGVQLDAAEVRSYYESHTSSFVDVCASEILVATPVDADAVLARLDHGLSFAAAAKRYSEDTQTASNGGAVGCGTVPQYAQVFGPTVASVVAGLAIDKPSAPVEISQGVAIFEVTSRSELPFAQSELTAANDQLAVGSTRLNALLARESALEPVVVNPRYGVLRRIGGVLQVAPRTITPSKVLSEYFTPTRVR